MDATEASQFLTKLLRVMVSRKASDLFLNAGFPPALKLQGRVHRLSDTELVGEHTRAVARVLMNDRQSSEFEASNECNFAISPAGVGRFRVNAYVQRGQVAMVLRAIPDHIPTLEELALPAVIKERIALERRGLVLVVGATSSGKSTTLAAMIDYRNASSEDHIITIEDPIEFLHPNRRSMVSQREIGSDTVSWSAALRNALRQAPDVIMIGEIRDRETMEHAITFAETGHLCMGTLHSNNANQALDRIINFFPEDRRNQLLLDLSLNLKAIISQRLIPTKDGTGRVPAVEVLVGTPLAKDYIRDAKIHELKELMKKSESYGMQTFDQALLLLYRDGKIAEDDAKRYADSKAEVSQGIRSIQQHWSGVTLSDPNIDIVRGERY